MRYAVVVEKAENNYSAYVPDLPGCVAAAETKEAPATEAPGAKPAGPAQHALKVNSAL